MNTRTIISLAVAGVLGLLAVFLLNKYIGKAVQAPQVAQSGAGVPVVVASLPVTRGSALQPGVLKVVNYPQGSVPIGAFSAVNQLAGPNGTQRFALRDISPDEPVLPGSISGPGGKLTMSGVLTPGMQAVAIRSSDVAGVGGFVTPGDRVDVLLTRVVASGDQSNSVSQILAENVRVMGVDQSDNNQDSKPVVSHTVTVEVSPAQAQAIALGQAIGQVSMTLRHVSDSAVQARRATTTSDLGHFGPPPAAARPAASAPAGSADAAGTPLYGPGIVRVTRVTETTGYRVLGR